MGATDIFERRQGDYRAGIIFMTALGVAFVILRFSARWKKGLRIGAGDYVILLSLLFLFATRALNLAMIHFGVGRHADILPEGNIVIIAKLLMSFECVYCTTVGIVKISISLLVVIGWVIGIICVSMFQCTSIAKAWDQNLRGTCINLKGSFIGNAVPNILTDIAILTLPVRVVWGLHATVTHRLLVIAVFLLGSFVLFTGAYLFSTLFEFQPTDTPWTLAKGCT